MFKTNILTEEYTKVAFETSKRRITQAGYRLANIIISIYQGEAVVKTKQERFKDVEGHFQKRKFKKAQKIEDL